MHCFSHLFVAAFFVCFLFIVCVCVRVDCWAQCRIYQPNTYDTHTTWQYGEISDAPIYIYIHGGYWQIVDICKEVSAHGVAPLVAAGIKVIVMNYEKCPNVSLERLVEEMERAIEFILDFGLKQGTRYE